MLQLKQHQQLSPSWLLCCWHARERRPQRSPGLRWLWPSSPSLTNLVCVSDTQAAEALSENMTFPCKDLSDQSCPLKYMVFSFSLTTTIYNVLLGAAAKRS